MPARLTTPTASFSPVIPETPDPLDTLVGARPSVERPAITRADLLDAEEEREKDLVTFRLGARRRYWSTLFIGSALAVSVLGGLSTVPVPLMIGLAVSAFGMNYGLTRLATSSSTYRWWFRYVFATFDAALISTLNLVFGASQLVVVYFLAIVPYSFDRGKTLGFYTSIASVMGFLLSSLGHRALNPDAPDTFGWTLLAAALLLVVSFQIVPIPARLIRRIRVTRESITAAEQGNLLVRAEARYRDELGFLERSFNRMLEEIGHTIGAVQREADEVATYAEQLAGAALQLNASGNQVAAMAATLSGELETQRVHAATGMQQTSAVLVATERLRDRAGRMESDAQSLLETTGTSRDAIGRASTTLVEIGERVRDAASTVSALSDASAQVGDFVDAVSRIAKQTNLLALNAAIEAARAGEHGKGFAVVAEEVRKLAEESSAAARQIAATIANVRESIATATQTMSVGERQVRNVGEVAGSANQALGTILEGVERLVEVITEASAVSRAQSAAMGALSGAIVQIQSASTDASAQARDASRIVSEQTASLDGLAATSRELAELADRLRSSISRFSVSTVTREEEIPSRASSPAVPSAG